VEKINNILNTVVKKTTSAQRALAQRDNQQENTKAATPITAPVDRPAPKNVPRRKRSGPSSDLISVKNILRNALRIKGLDKKIERYSFIPKWPEIVGPAFAEVSHPECITRRALVVRVTNNAWAQEMSFMKSVILQKVQECLPNGTVLDDVVFRIKPE